MAVQQEDELVGLVLYADDVTMHSRSRVCLRSFVEEAAEEELVWNVGMMKWMKFGRR